MRLDNINLSLPASKPRMFQWFAVVGGLTLIAGLILAPQRIWPNILLTSFALVAIGLAGLFFVALQYVTSAGWSVVIRRVAEAMTATLPLGAIGIIAVLILKPSLYSWFSESITHTENLTGFKLFWLSRPFLIVRSLAYLAIWIVFSRFIIGNSRRQDQDGSWEHTARNVRLSAGFIVLYAVTFSLASFDWIMSLEPHWYSTMFGVYNFAGMFVSGLAIIIILVVWLSQRGPLRGLVTEEHLHDLGKLLFAFSIFWMYIWFCQYMLIWYANFPEEAVYFTRRMQGAWQPLMILNISLNWAVPFLVLLPAATKKNPATIVRISVVILAGRWLDLYLMIAPSSAGESPTVGIWEVGMLLGLIGVATLLIRRELIKAAVVPIKDPYLHESLHHHQ